MKLPKHVGMHISHNEHRLYYQTVEEYIAEQRNMLWVPGDSRARAIASGELWSVQWYPDTPVGYCIVHGETLQEILDYINE